MTVPSGFGIDSFVRPRRAGPSSVQQTGSGDSAVDHEGHLDRRQDADRRGLAVPVPRPARRRAKTYTFRVSQTYSDGSIVNWAGPESSDAPAPTIEAHELARRWRQLDADDHRARRRGARPARRRVRARRAAPGSARWHEPRGGGSSSRSPWRSRCSRRCRAPRRRTRTWSRRCPRRAACSTFRPPTVQLTFDEAVEPRFAIISVTDAAGAQETTGPRRRSPSDPDTLVVPLRPHLPEGWYLIYWRAISVDGHPVQGAFTYAVGPNPGPAPQFPVPSDLGDGDHAAAADRALGDVPRR